MTVVTAGLRLCPKGCSAAPIAATPGSLQRLPAKMRQPLRSSLRPASPAQIVASALHTTMDTNATTWALGRAGVRHASNTGAMCAAASTVSPEAGALSTPTVSIIRRTATLATSRNISPKCRIRTTRAVDAPFAQIAGHAAHAHNATAHVLCAKALFRRAQPHCCRPLDWEPPLK